MELEDNPILYKIRHSMAHVLAQAVKKVYPEAKLGFGPPTDTGFFYDFDFEDVDFKEDSLKAIEKEMRKIIGQKQEFVRSATDADGAIARLSELGEGDYKIENVRNLRDRGVSEFSFYDNGTFADLCEGPHVETTGDLPAKAFKLDRVAGAYWLETKKTNSSLVSMRFALKLRNNLKILLTVVPWQKSLTTRNLGKSSTYFISMRRLVRVLPFGFQMAR